MFYFMFGSRNQANDPGMNHRSSACFMTWHPVSRGASPACELLSRLRITAPCKPLSDL